MAERRSRGEGRWLTLPHGYKLTISLGLYPDGSRRRKSFSGPTMKAVRERRDQYLAETRAGLSPSDEPLRSYLPTWLSVKRDSLRPSTYQSYASIVTTRLVPQLGGVKLSELRPAHVRDFLHAVVKAGRTPQYANQCRIVLGAAVRDALREGLVARNVVSLARSLPEVPRPLEPLSVEEVHRVLDYLKGSRWYAPTYVSVALGIRQGELLGLLWSDVEESTIHVRHTLHRLYREYTLGEPKTASSRRELPLAPVEAVLAAVRKEQDDAKEAKGWEPWPWDLVFRDARGPLNRSTLAWNFHEALDALGIPRRRWHDLRSTTATFLLSEGVDLAVIRDVLGHASITTTAKLYAKVMPRLRAGALDRVAALMEARETVGTLPAPKGGESA